jgi:hypothetical protein
VVTLRCTRALLARLGQRPDGEAPASTTRLGDWYGHLVRLGPTQLLIFISEHTRLPVLLPARNARAVATTLADAVERTLRSLGIAGAAVADERARMSAVCFATTRSPSLLGTINEYIFTLRAFHALDPSRSLEAKAADLAGMPLLKLGGRSAQALTLERFALSDPGEQPAAPTQPRAPEARSAGAPPAVDVPVEIRGQLDRWAQRWLQRFLPMLLPPPPDHPFNYPVAVFGEWTGGCFFLCARYRAGRRPREEFVVQQTRLTPRGFGRFDLAYRRPNDQWATVHRSLTAAECQRRIEADERFWPIV